MLLYNVCIKLNILNTLNNYHFFMVKSFKIFSSFKKVYTILLLSMITFLCKGAPEPISVCNLVDHGSAFLYPPIFLIPWKLSFYSGSMRSTSLDPLWLRLCGLWLCLLFDNSPTYCSGMISNCAFVSFPWWLVMLSIFQYMICLRSFEEGLLTYLIMVTLSF